MGGSAILDPDVLVDSLVVDVIDSLRSELHQEFGVRAYRVYTVLTTWSGADVGEGTKTEVETEITPQPVVDMWSDQSALRYELANCGIDELGRIRLREVSLSYTEAELIGPRATMTGNQQWSIRLRDAHGQLTQQRTFVHMKPPYIDREKDMGWVLWLRASEEVAS